MPPPRFRHSTLLALVAASAGCGSAKPKPESRSPDTLAQPAASSRSLPDSLALAIPGGAEVWFTGSRTATDSAGQPCVERVMEIRRPDGTRTPIPLLYTGAAPVLRNDSTIRARIWLNCRPGNTYDVNLRTGHPTRVQ